MQAKPIRATFPKQFELSDLELSLSQAIGQERDKQAEELTDRLEEQFSNV